MLIPSHRKVREPTGVQASSFKTLSTETTAQHKPSGICDRNSSSFQRPNRLLSLPRLALLEIPLELALTRRKRKLPAASDGSALSFFLSPQLFPIRVSACGTISLLPSFFSFRHPPPVSTSASSPAAICQSESRLRAFRYRLNFSFRIPLPRFLILAAHDRDASRRRSCLETSPAFTGTLKKIVTFPFMPRRVPLKISPPHPHRIPTFPLQRINLCNSATLQKVP